MKKLIHIYVNGILTFPGQSDNWNGKAVTWNLTESEFAAEKIEYYVGPISRVFRQKKRAGKLRKTMQRYIDKGWEVTLIGHSNGCMLSLTA